MNFAYDCLCPLHNSTKKVRAVQWPVTLVCVVAAGTGSSLQTLLMLLMLIDLVVPFSNVHTFHCLTISQQ